MPRFKEVSGGTSDVDAAGESARLRIRLGDLRQDARPDPDGSLESREPDEIFDVLAEAGLYENTREARRAAARMTLEQMKARRAGGP